MKIKLIFGRTVTDYETCWVDAKEAEVDVPDGIVCPADGQGTRHVIGAIIPENDERKGHEQ